MEILLKRNYGHYIVFKAENVCVEEDVEERTYKKGADGKLVFNLNPERDITENCVSQFVNVLEDIIYYRIKPYDSSLLVERLMEKMPEDKRIELITRLVNDYIEPIEE